MPPCEFEFVCDKKFTDLAPTRRKSVRFCGDCQKNMFQVSTQDQRDVAGVLGQCVEYQWHSDPDFGVVGMMERMWDRPGAARVAVRRNVSVSAARLVELRRNVPRLFDAAANEMILLQGKVLPIGDVNSRVLDLLAVELKKVAPEVELMIDEKPNGSNQIDLLR